MAERLGRFTIYLDGSGLPERDLIGGKAWSVARMTRLGLPVPPAFVITTAACREYLQVGTAPADLAAELRHGIDRLEAATGRRFGQGPRALLVSVRSGAAISMPGMMDTILNLGMTPAVEAALAAESGLPEFAADTHRRFREMFTRIVGSDGVPDAPTTQLERAVNAVFESWNSRRARRYRAHHGIPDDTGTAVTVQAMVFGNLDLDSGTGVLFSRNPLTGDPEPYGEYLPRAQGEDVVSGTVTPAALTALFDRHPEVHDQLLAAARLLEEENGDVQDVEFTVQHGHLYLLQSRPAKRAPAAAARIAVDFARSGRISPREALASLTADQVRSMLKPHLTDEGHEHRPVIARGEAASPGVGVGLVVTDADEAERATEAGIDVVLARETTSPEDVHGMLVARAVITDHGGTTSHAAVVSRSLALPCVVGCGAGTAAAVAGRVVTVDGRRGLVFDGALEVVSPDESADPILAQLRTWARAELGVAAAERMGLADMLERLAARSTAADQQEEMIHQ